MTPVMASSYRTLPKEAAGYASSALQILSRVGGARDQRGARGGPRTSMGRTPCRSSAVPARRSGEDILDRLDTLSSAMATRCRCTSTTPAPNRGVQRIALDRQEQAECGRQTGHAVGVNNDILVGAAGIEPATPCL